MNIVARIFSFVTKMNSKNVSKAAPAETRVIFWTVGGQLRLLEVAL